MAKKIILKQNHKPISNSNKISETINKAKHINPVRHSLKTLSALEITEAHKHISRPITNEIVNENSAPAKSISVSDIENEEIIFSLDIGTRSVIGIIGYQKGENFVVIDSEIVKHSHRCMVDGQIQDINMVASVIIHIKKALETRNKITLKNVSIAAAGRTLITQNGHAERKTQNNIAINRDFITSLEMEAVENALTSIKKENTADISFYCVGHSIISQTLDKYPISNLEGHKGDSVTMDIIAAFLPSSVVDSLNTAMEEAGLTVHTLTLEPIAAINALIPKELRMLNLALVDIGAGTSDIAISKDGSVVSYAMATVAGDEITESLINTLLVDFHTAERIKLSLSDSPEIIKYTDILGFSYEKTYDEIVASISESFSNLVDTVCDKILEINKASPTAVFLAGGGSLIPNLTERVAKKLQMSPNRVAIKSNSFLKNIEGNCEYMDDPQFVTPLGIALTSIMQNGFDLYFVTLNGEKIRIINDDNITVNDVLSQAGIQMKQLIGLSGKSLIYELNGKRNVRYGGMSVQGKILINGKEENIRSYVKSGDKIEITMAENGKDALLKLKDLIDFSHKGNVTIGPSKVSLNVQCTVNGSEKDGEYIVNNYDVINTKQISTLSEALDYLHISAVDNIFISNGTKIGLGHILADGENIECKPKSQISSEPAKTVINEIKTEEKKLENLKPTTEIPPEKDSTPQKNISNKSNENIPENKDILPKSETDKNNKVVSEEKGENYSFSVVNRKKELTVFVNGKPHKLQYHDNGTPPMFADATDLANIDLKRKNGKLIIRLNDREPNYTDFLKDGDDVKIYWEN